MVDSVPTNYYWRTFVAIPAKGGRFNYPENQVVTAWPGNPGTGTAGWIAAPHVIPKFYQILPSGRGQATFDIKLQNFLPGTNRPATSTIDIKGQQWICICAAATYAEATPANINAIKWAGYVVNATKLPKAGTGYFQGAVVAKGIGHYIDQHPLSKIRDITGRVLTSFPTFNFKQDNGIVGNFTAGTSGGLEGAFTVDRSKLVNAQFTKGVPRWPDDGEGNKSKGAWTRLKILLHILSNNSPSNLPTFELDSGAGLVNQCREVLNNPKPEVFNLSNATLGHALDLLISRQHGMGWALDIYESRLIVRPYTISPEDIKGEDGTTVYVPANPPITVNTNNFDTLQDFATQIKELRVLEQDTSDRVDKIIVEGNRIVCAFTIAGPAFNSKYHTFEADWGRGLLSGPVPFNSQPLTYTAKNNIASLRKGPVEQWAQEYSFVVADGPAADDERNQWIRTQPWLQKVFSNFRLRLSPLANDNGALVEDGILRRNKDPLFLSTATDNDLAFRAVCPKFTWDGTNLTFEDVVPTTKDHHATPNISDLRILKVIPWNKGWAVNYRGEIVKPKFDTDAEDEYGQQQYVKPIFLNYKDGRWIDMINPGEDLLAPKVTVNNNDGTFQIEYTYRELIAKEEYKLYKAENDPFDPTLQLVGASAVDPTIHPSAVAWQNCMITLAVESDQRVSVTKYRDETQPAPDNPQDTFVGRVLKVTNADLHCHFLPAKTVVGWIHETDDLISTDTNQRLLPSQLVDPIFIRNDFAAAERLACELAGFCFRATAVMDLEMALLDAAPSIKEKGPHDFIQIGAMIGSVQANRGVSGSSYNINTPVESIEVNLEQSAPSIRVTTALPPVPEIGGAVMMGGGSGSVIPALGGTVVNATKKAQEDIRMLKEEAKSIPIHTPTGSVKTFTDYQIYGEIYGGNATPLTKPDEDDFNTWTFPDTKNHIFSLAPDEEPVNPTDWEDLKLPKTFEHGDDLPEAWPPGLGLVRLLKGSAPFGTSSWDADLETFGSDEDEPTQDVVWLVKAQVRNSSELYLYFSEAVTWTGAYEAIPVNQLVTVAFTDQDAEGNPLDPVTITSFNGVTDNIAKFSLSRSIEDNETGIMTGVFAGLVKDAQGNLNLNLEGSVEYSPTVKTIIFSLARNCYVYVINTQAGRGLLQGDLVDLQDNGVTVDDLQSTPQTLTFLDCLPRNGGFIPHTHMNGGSGLNGGGMAMASFAPTTFQGLVAANMANVIRLEQND